MRYLCALLLVSCVSLAGCQQRPYAAHTSIHPARSVVFDAPETDAMAVRLPAAEPWFVDRNDYERFTVSGYVGAQVDRSYSRTYDHQHHHDRHVHNHYWQYSVGERVIESGK